MLDANDTHPQQRSDSAFRQYRQRPERYTYAHCCCAVTTCSGGNTSRNRCRVSHTDCCCLGECDSVPSRAVTIASSDDAPCQTKLSCRSLFRTHTTHTLQIKCPALSRFGHNAYGFYGYRHECAKMILRCLKEILP